MTDNWQAHRAEAERLHPQYAEIANAERADAEEKRILMVQHADGSQEVALPEGNVEALRARKAMILDTFSTEKEMTQEQVDRLIAELTEIFKMLDEDPIYDDVADARICAKTNTQL